MNKAIIFILLFTYSFLSTARDPQHRNLLTGKISPEELSDILSAAKDWHPYPTIDEPDVWDQFPEYVRNFFINEGEKYLDYSWPVIPATAALNFVRSGNRTSYESVSFERRRALSSMVMAELFERQGRFTDQIINGIWAICEETYWGVSAHLGMQSKGAGLPDVAEPTIDLFAAETSCQLAWVLYLLGSQLDRGSPLIRERIEYEIQRRILTPGLEREDFWWMGYDGGSLNNWTPWICSNWLPSVMLIEKAYPEEAGIQSLRRTIDFIRGKKISVTDQYQFDRSDNELEMNMMTHFLVKENKNGKITLVNRNKPEDILFIHYDDNIFSLKTENIPITDSRLKPVWGDELIRLVFSANKISNEFEYTFLIKRK